VWVYVCSVFYRVFWIPNLNFTADRFYKNTSLHIFYRWAFSKFMSTALHSDITILSVANIGTCVFIQYFYLPQYEWCQSYHLHTNKKRIRRIKPHCHTDSVFFFTISAILLWIIKHVKTIHVTGHVASTWYYIFNTNPSILRKHSD